MSEEIQRPRLREFADRSIRWMLRTPAFLRDFLSLAQADVVDQLDFDRLEALDTTLIPPTLARQEADLLFRIPYRTPAAQTADAALLYVLIEHQSGEERLISVRLLGLYWQLLDQQCREWLDRGGQERDLYLRPVVMVVFHTGERPWRAPIRLTGLMRLERGTEAYVPEYRVHLLDLPATSDEALVEKDLLTGWLLRALRMERAGTQAFAAAVSAAEARLDRLPESADSLWKRGTQYLLMLIYYRRARGEQPALWRRMEEAVATPRRREELETMIKTYAEELLDEGRVEGRAEGARDAARQLILASAVERFGGTTPELEAAVRSRDDLAQLEELLRRILRAERLEDIDLGLN